ncbi:MAG: hypothetical protein OEY59_12600 [Deltaproteobacteria bacterium]|nr:hypothetical protein [Deltaproteobacteria bacterium]
MKSNVKRGPKKGRRVTPEIQTDIVMSALNSNSSIQEIIENYKKEGYNFNNSLDKRLQNIYPYEISFMLANQEILTKVKDEAVNLLITDIKSK